MADTNQATEGSNGEKRKRNFGPKEPVHVTVSQILAWLDAGETRADIAAKLGMNIGQVNALFASSPKLKGKKTRKDLTKSFVLTDDIPDEQAGASNGTGTNVAGSTVSNPAPQEQAASWD